MKIFGLKTILSILVLLPLFAEAQVNPHDGVAHKHHHHDLHLVPMARWKFYGGVGATTYAGEMTGKKVSGLMKSIEPRLSFNVGAGYKFHDRFILKAELGYYKIKAVATERASQENRFFFKSNNIDFALLSQFNIIPYTYLISKERAIVPYLLLGIGFTTSNPRGLLNNEWVSLKEISNGQVQNKVLATVPFGLGAVYRVNCLFDIGLDATVRYTLGGSLDGDSREGINTALLTDEGRTYFDHYYNDGYPILQDNPKFHDLYTNIQIRVTYTMIGEKYRHLFKQRDINQDPNHHHHGSYNHHIRMHE